MVRRIIKYTALFAVFALIYMVLREAVSPVIFLLGFGIAVFAVFFSDRFLLDERYENIFCVNFFRFIGYFFYLLYKIILSGAKTAIMALRGHAEYTTFIFNSELDNDFKLNLLANSITLTPGTITINRENGDLMVLQLIHIGDQADTSDIAKFETKLKRM